MENQAETEVINPCPVCLETMNGKNQFTTLCGHQFCASCILSNVEYADNCPLCRVEIGIDLPSPPVNIIPSMNETRAIGGIGLNPRVVNQNRRMHLIEVDCIIDHLSNSTNTTLTHARHMVWNDVALLFNQVFTGENQPIDRPTQEMLHRSLADLCYRDFGEALHDFITNDIRTYLNTVVHNLEIEPEIDDILNTLDQDPDNINLIENYIIENFDNINEQLIEEVD